MPAQRSALAHAKESRREPYTNKPKPYQGTIRKPTAPYKGTIRNHTTTLHKPEDKAPVDDKLISRKRRMPETSARPTKRLKEEPQQEAATSRKRRRVIEDSDDDAEAERCETKKRKMAPIVVKKTMQEELKPPQKRKAESAAEEMSEPPRKRPAIRKQQSAIVKQAPQKSNVMEKIELKRGDKMTEKSNVMKKSEVVEKSKELKKNVELKKESMTSEKSTESEKSIKSMKSKATEVTDRPGARKLVGFGHVQSVLQILAAVLDPKIMRKELDPITPAEEYEKIVQDIINACKQAEKDGKTVASTIKNLPKETLPGREQRCLEAIQLLAALDKANEAADAKKVLSNYLFQCVFAHFNRKKNGGALWDDASQQDPIHFLMIILDRLRDLAVTVEGEAESEEAQMTYLDEQFKLYTDNAFTCSECGHTTNMTGTDWALPLTIQGDGILHGVLQFMINGFLEKEQDVKRHCENCCACQDKCDDCEQCTKKVNGSNKILRIKKTPENLVFRVGRIDRAKNTSRMNPVRLPLFETIKIKLPGSAEEEIEYKLKAVIKHEQHTKNYGRYITYIMHKDGCFRYCEKDVQHIEHDDLSARLQDSPKELSHLIVLQKA